MLMPDFASSAAVRWISLPIHLQINQLACAKKDYKLEWYGLILNVYHLILGPVLLNEPLAQTGTGKCCLVLRCISKY